VRAWAKCLTKKNSPHFQESHLWTMTFPTQKCFNLDNNHHFLPLSFPIQHSYSLCLHYQKDLHLVTSFNIYSIGCMEVICFSQGVKHA